MADDVSGLTQLGVSSTEYKDPVLSILEAFPNKYPSRDYLVTHVTDEFTSRCPKTGQPDFAQITIEYVPDQSCIETKSLKLYLAAYRNTGAFMESITNQILEDIVQACSPRKLAIIANFNIRGGIATTVRAAFDKGS